MKHIRMNRKYEGSNKRNFSQTFSWQGRQKMMIDNDLSFSDINFYLLLPICAKMFRRFVFVIMKQESLKLILISHPKEN